MAATRTSTRQAAQKAKEAIAAGPDTKSKSGAGAKRKEAAHKGPEPKRSKKDDQKPARDEDQKVEEQKGGVEEQVKEKKEEPVQQEAEGEKVHPVEEQAEGAKSQQNEEQAEGEKQQQNEERSETKKEEPEEEQAVGAKEEQKEEQLEKKREKPAADRVESGVQKTQEREDAVPSNILEKGVIYFFYRSRVNVSEPNSVDDVARSFIVLRPTPLGASLDQTQGSLEPGAKCRLMLLPKKKFPASGRERDMGFVEKTGQTMKELQENYLSGEKYETSTRGERTVPEAKLYAEGVYAITSTKRASHLAYILTIPGEVGPLQEDFGLHARGSWIVQSKNPKYPGPSSAQLPKDPEYPESVREKFQDYRWAPLTPEFIDYPNAQFLMIGEATDDLGKAATAEPDGKRSEEAQPWEEIWDWMRVSILRRRLRCMNLAILRACWAMRFMAAAARSTVVNQTTCGGTTYAYTGLEGYGYIPSNATDKYGDTIGGIGSSIAMEPGSWRRTGRDSYSGTVYALPDRGWNTNGTLNFQPRIHKIALTLTLARNASAHTASPPNLRLKYLDTVLLTGPDGLPTTGLDADVTGAASYPGYPPLPAATYVGDGFGGAGPGGKRVSMDPEGLAIDNDGGFWVSDEYGPYVYKFSKEGRMELAVQPPDAILPRRNGTLSFSAASPPVYAPELKVNPEDPQSGRNNNQGLEALTLSADGKTLYAMMQSALNQEGGPKKKNRQPARLLEYDISSGKPVYQHEYVVLLPKYDDYTKNESVVASQSEIHILPTGDFLVLSRDSGFGHGQGETRSVYRHADVISIANSTTDLKGKYDGVGASVASSKGVLNDGLTPVEYCSFLDYNVESELAKFGLHNGGSQDALLLNEKWESFALVPVEPEQRRRGSKNEYFLFSFSDNDFMTQDGHMNFGRYKYADESGYNIDNQVLVFRVEF
ncbi:esterase-like activity of phytase-domain-containing protein [Aspergillus pseudonomiae]|uniref:Esterase-like activity of phytase-domain-containing protein n=1 Tax=Aspergillus pseudonomiae TaxID=1506151 RepID=A0A5N7DP03_9EURO|nr:esterase-like activity of phytase-domain-containing protein [Aspergillus pseudonomiae]KAE8407208.1 esterase-like activity of phytase-domain-containing protein [Aspergillus pseudonomiae]